MAMNLFKKLRAKVLPKRPAPPAAPAPRAPESKATPPAADQSRSESSGGRDRNRSRPEGGSGRSGGRGRGGDSRQRQPRREGERNESRPPRQREPRRDGERNDSRPPRQREPQQDRQPQQERERTPPEPEVAPEPWDPASFKVEPKEGFTRFHDLELPETLMHSIADLGFEYCTPIQAQVMPITREGKNVAGRAQTGTGKTAAFLISAFAQFSANPIKGERKVGAPRCLVLAPTRELCVQIMRDAEKLGTHSNFECQAVFGGMDYERQARALRSRPVDVLAATPGRLLDFAQKRVLDLSQVEVLVIDEADRMLDMGFIPDVRRIVGLTPPKQRRQTLLFSATLTDDVMRLASQWMPDPVKIEIEPDQVTADTVKQIVYMVTASQKFTVLVNMIKKRGFKRVLVFANRRDRTERLASELSRYDIHCELLSGAVNQNKRMRVVDGFREGKIDVVVATDVAGRGLHVDDIDLVVNYELPYEPDDYVHRIGRTGRAGNEGTAVSYACEDESFIIPEIEAYLGDTLKCCMPEEELLGQLPRPSQPAKRFSTESPDRRGGGGGGRSGGGGGGRGRPGGGGRSSGPRGGGGRR